MKINEVAKSQQQMKYIYAMRGKYGSKKKAPKNMKWVFDEEWTSGIKMKKLPKKIKKNESHIMNFASFVNESYDFEDFTMNDMEYVKELWNDGMEDVAQIAIESDLDKPTVIQILATLKKRGDIEDIDGVLESEHFDEHDEDHSGCGCHICNCTGDCDCGCCCSDKSDGEEMELLYCKKCGEYIGGISPSNLCLGCQPRVDD